MAELVLTEVDIKLGGSGCKVAVVQLGETATIGMPVRIDTSDNKYYLADNSTEEDAKASAITLCRGLADDYVPVLIEGPLDIAASVNIEPGQSYAVAPTSGKIYLASELSTSDWATHIGIGKDTNVIDIKFNATGVQAA